MVIITVTITVEFIRVFTTVIIITLTITTIVIKAIKNIIVNKENYILLFNY